MSYFVYSLADPLSDTVAYIGITDNLYERFKAHMGDKTQGHPKVIWIKNLKQSKLIPSLKVIECTDTLKNAKQREKYWIYYYLNQGVCLTNIVHASIHDGIHRTPQIRTLGGGNDLLSIADIMQEYDVSRMTVNRRVSEGTLTATNFKPALYRQHKLLFHRQDVERALQKNKDVVPAA